MQNELLGLLNEQSFDKRLYKTPKLTKIDHELIVINPLNKIDIDGIEELAESIHSYGLLKPLEVYKLDDYHYRLTGGERRWTAIKLLMSKGLHDGEDIPCLVYERLDEEWKERLIMEISNADRERTEEKIIVRTKNLLEIWELMPKENRPKGEKRMWIAGFLGCKARTAQKYINLALNKAEPKKEKVEVDYSYAEQLVQNLLRTRIKIDKKKVTIYHTGTDDLNRILELIGAIEE